MAAGMKSDVDAIKRSLWALAIIAIVICAVWVRTRGLTGHLPFIYDPDEPAFLTPAAKMLRDGDPNPHWFQHPGSTIIYLNAALMIVWGWLQTGSLSLQGAASAYFADPTAVVWTIRQFNELLGACAVVATYLVATRAFRSMTIGFAAAAIVAVMPLHVPYSQVVRTDILAGVFVLMAVYFAVRIAEERRLSDYVAAGAMIGFGVATKYPAAVAAIAVMFAHMSSVSGWMKESWKLFLAGAVSLLAAFVASPFLFLDIEATLSDLAKETTSSHYNATGAGFAGNLIWYLKSLYGLLGISGSAAVVVGLVVAGWRRGPGLVVLVFALVFLAFISSLGLKWTRWLIPLTPFVAMFAALGLVFLAETAGGMFGKPLFGAAFGVALCIALALLLGGKFFVGTTPLPDTRTIARQWAVDNIPAGSRIVQEFYTPQMPVSKYRLFRFRGRSLAPADTETYQNFIPAGFAGESTLDGIEPGDYVMLSSSAYTRFEGTEKWARYEFLLASGETIYQAGPKAGIARGPTIIIVKVSDMWTAPR